jgi:hypothetical protein
MNAQRRSTFNHDVEVTKLVELIREALPEPTTDAVTAAALQVIESMAERLNLSNALRAYLNVQYKGARLTGLSPIDAEQALKFVAELLAPTD